MHRSGAKRLVLSVLHGLVQPGHSLAAVKNAFDLINTSYVSALQAR